MQDVSGFGLIVTLYASVTYPAGINLTSFADDSDPFDLPSIQLRDKAMGLNGDLVVWGKANPIVPTLAVIPNSEDDKNLQVLAEANRVQKGKAARRDVIRIVAVYPDGETLTLTQGAITDAPIGNSIGSSGRMKSKAYGFAFEASQRAAAPAGV